VARCNLILLGGIAAVVAGVFSFCVTALYILLLMSEGAIPMLVPPLLTLGSILTAFLYVLGLVGLHALSGGRSGMGTAGLVLAALAFGTTLLPWAFGVAYALYQVVFLSRTVVATSALIFPQVAVGLLGDALLAGGILLLAVVGWRARALGRWTFVPFGLAFLYAFPIPLWAAINLGSEIPLPLPPSPALLVGPFWVLLGAVLWRRALGVRTGGAIPAHDGGARRA
jgi:hypothetical protein